MRKIKPLRKNDSYLTKMNRINDAFVEFELSRGRRFMKTAVDTHKRTKSIPKPTHARRVGGALS
jgi:hypothetical protein